MGQSDSILGTDLEEFDPDLRRSFEVDDTVPQEIKDKADVKIRKDSILLSGDQTFFTLQGEGPTVGRPCVFCRLHVCNLRCTWCDAFYTWNPSSKEFWTESTRASFEQCAKLIKMTDTGSSHRVVFTGGEPLIQKTQIDEVWDILRKHTMLWRIEIETNGTLMPTVQQLKFAQFNCSPKLPNSDNKLHSMIKPKVLAELNKANTTYKFVCRHIIDLEEIEEHYLHLIDEGKIIIMPEGIVEEEITHHARLLYEPVLERGWRMTPRFQAIFADGARRRV